MVGYGRNHTKDKRAIKIRVFILPLKCLIWIIIQYVALPRAAEEEHWSIPPNVSTPFTQTNTIASNMYVDRPWPRAGCFCAHSTIDTHCTARNLKKIPAGLIKKILREHFYKLCRSWARQWGAMQYNRWRLCCRELQGLFQVSWGLKWYWGKIISPETNPAIGTFRDVPSSKSHHPYNIKHSHCVFISRSIWSMRCQNVWNKWSLRF